MKLRIEFGAPELQYVATEGKVYFFIVLLLITQKLGPYKMISSLLTQDAHYINGLVLYTLDQLYRNVERDAKAFGEWYRLVSYFFHISYCSLTRLLLFFMS